MRFSSHGSDSSKIGLSTRQAAYFLAPIIPRQFLFPEIISPSRPRLIPFPSLACPWRRWTASSWCPRRVGTSAKKKALNDVAVRSTVPCSRTVAAPSKLATPLGVPVLPSGCGLVTCSPPCRSTVSGGERGEWINHKRTIAGTPPVSKSTILIYLGTESYHDLIWI